MPKSDTTRKKKEVPYDEMSEDEQEDFRNRCCRFVKCATTFAFESEDEDV